MPTRFTLNGTDVTCDALAPVKVTWGRQHPRESIEPRRLVVGFDGRTTPRRGDTLALEVGAPGTDHTWGAAAGTWAVYAGTWLEARVWLRLFTGRVTDTATSWDPAGDGTAATADQVVTDVTAVDPLAALAGVVVGDAPFPAEAADARARRIADLTPIPWDVEAAPQQVAARDVDAQAALDLLDDLAAAVSLAGGCWFDPTNGRAQWLTVAGRTSRAPQVILTSAEIDAAAKLVQDPGDVINTAAVGYVNTADPQARPEAVHVDPSSVDAYGPRKARVSTALTVGAQAADLARNLVTRYGVATPKWQAVRVALEDLDASRAQVLLGLGPRARVRLEDLPMPAEASWTGYVEGWSLELNGPEVRDWVVDLDLSPARWSGPLLTWADLAAAGTWAAVVGTWADMTDTVGLGPQVLTNGDFASALTGWSVFWSARTRFDTAAGTVLVTSDEADGIGTLEQALPGPIPSTRQLKVTGRVRSSDPRSRTLVWLCSNTPPALPAPFQPGLTFQATPIKAGTDWTPFAVSLAVMDTTHTTAAVFFRSEGMPDGATVEWDDLEVRWRT